MRQQASIDFLPADLSEMAAGRGVKAKPTEAEEEVPLPPGFRQDKYKPGEKPSDFAGALKGFPLEGKTLRKKAQARKKPDFGQK